MSDASEVCRLHRRLKIQDLSMQRLESAGRSVGQACGELVAQRSALRQSFQSLRQGLAASDGEGGKGSPVRQRLTAMLGQLSLLNQRLQSTTAEGALIGRRIGGLKKLQQGWELRLLQLLEKEQVQAEEGLIATAALKSARRLSPYQVPPAFMSVGSPANSASTANTSSSSGEPPVKDPRLRSLGAAGASAGELVPVVMVPTNSAANTVSEPSWQPLSAAPREVLPGKEVPDSDCSENPKRGAYQEDAGNASAHQDQAAIRELSTWQMGSENGLRIDYAAADGDRYEIEVISDPEGALNVAVATQSRLGPQALRLLQNDLDRAGLNVRELLVRPRAPAIS